jgi:hypothetical protein
MIPIFPAHLFDSTSHAVKNENCGTKLYRLPHDDFMARRDSLKRSEPGRAIRPGSRMGEKSRAYGFAKIGPRPTTLDSAARAPETDAPSVDAPYAVRPFAASTRACAA